MPDPTPHATNQLRVEILTGYASPWAGSFDQDRVTIGRAQGSDVRLHPTQDTACAREHHAILERTQDGWRVTAQHASGITILDHHGRAKAKLEAGQSAAIEGECQFELGSGGPRLGASVVGEALPVTEVQSTAKAPLPVGRVSGDVVRNARRTPKIVAGVAVFGLLLAAGLAYWILDVRQRGKITEDITLDLHGTTRQLAQSTAEVQARTEALGQQAEALGAQTEAIRREAQESLDALRASIETGASLTRSQMEAVNTSIQELREQPTDRIAAVITEAAPSVWLPAVYNPETGAFSGAGTAWTVEGGQLATNAHVAQEILDQLKKAPGSIPVAFREGRRDEIVRLDPDFIIHPDYAPLSRMLDGQHRRTPDGGLRLVRYIPPCDVALLRPEDPDADLGRPLPLARDMVQQDLVGATVGYVGFPAENIAGLPVAQRVSGRLTSQTDFVFQPTPPEHAQVLHHTAVLAGGSSGSPLLNERGEVIGLVSAGSMAFTERGTRIPVGINYAQRVDLLVELLDNTAHDLSSERRARLADGLRSVMLDAKQILDQLCLEFFGKDVTYQIVDLEGVITGPGPEGGFTSVIELLPFHRYNITAASDAYFNTQLTILEGDQVALRNPSPTWYANIGINPMPQPVRVTVVAHTTDAIPDSGAPVRVRIARASLLRPPSEVFPQGE